VAVQLHTED